MTPHAMQELRALAEKATPGPWEWRYGSGLRSMHDRGEFNYGPEVLGLGPDVNGDTTLSLADVDAVFIAAVSPDVVLALLDENEKMRAALVKAAATMNAQIDEAHEAWAARDAWKLQAEACADAKGSR